MAAVTNCSELWRCFWNLGMLVREGSKCTSVFKHSRTSLSPFTFMHWRRKWQPTPVPLPGESQGPDSLVGCRLWGRQSRPRLQRLGSSSSRRRGPRRSKAESSGICALISLVPKSSGRNGCCRICGMKRSMRRKENRPAALLKRVRKVLRWGGRYSLFCSFVFLFFKEKSECGTSRLLRVCHAHFCSSPWLCQVLALWWLEPDSGESVCIREISKC